MKLKYTFDKQSLSIALVALLLGAALGAYFHKETIVARPGTADTSAAMTSVNLMIDYGDGTIKTWNTVSWHEAMSIINLMESVVAAKQITMLVDEDKNGRSSIKMISNITNDPKQGLRWQYWVNNIYEPAPANKYYLKPGDIVVWKYVKEQQEPAAVKK